MSDDLNTEIKISANADGVVAGVTKAKASIAGLVQAADEAGSKGGKGIEKIGDGAEAVVQKVGKVKKAVAEVGPAAATAGDQGSKGLAKAGDGADTAAQKIDRATKSMVASVQRQIAVQEAGGTSTRAYQESLARLRGVDVSVLKPYLDQLDALRAKQQNAGVSVAQTTAAFRQLPAQLTDVATQLAGGQSPFLILLQQGGQVKDSFGGLKETFRAFASALTPMTVGLIAGAAALTAVGVGVASLESQQRTLATFRVQLEATGRSSVATGTQLQGMVRDLSRLPGVTKDAATATVNELTKSHAIGAALFKDLTTLSADFARGFTNGDVPAAAKKLADAFADPAKGAKDLAAAMGTLTIGQQLVIEDLVKENNLRGAQQALLDAVKAKVTGLSSQVTPLSQATNDLGNAWNDAMKAFGQSEGLKSVVDLLTRVVQAGGWIIQNGDKIGAGLRFAATTNPYTASTAMLLGANPVSAAGALLGGPVPRGPAQESSGTVGVLPGATLPSVGPVLQDQVRSLNQANTAAITAAAGFKSFKEQQEDMRRVAANLRTQIDATNKAIKDGTAGDGAARTVEELRTRLAGVNEAIAKAAPTNTGQDEVAQIVATTKARREELQLLRQYGAEAVKLTDGDKLVIKIKEQLKESLSGVARAQKERALAAAQQQAGVDREIADENRLIKAKEELAKATAAVGSDADNLRARAAAQEAANASLGKSQVAIEQVTLAQLKLSAAQLDGTENSDPAYLAALNQKIAAQERYVQALKDGQFAAFEKNLAEQARANQETAQTLQLEASLTGQTAEVRGVILARRQAEVKLAKELAAIDRLDATTPEDEQRKAQLRAQARANFEVEAQNAAAQRLVAINERMADQLNQSLTDALLRGFESGKGFAENLRDTVKNMFGTLILRPIIQAVISPVTGLVTGLVNTAMGTGAAGAVAGTVSTGAGGLGTGLTLASAVKSLSDAATGAANFLNGITPAKWIQSGINYFTGTAGAPVGSVASTAGAAVGVAGGVIGGISVGRAISGGYSLNGGTGNSTVNAGTAVGAAIGSIIPGLGTALGAFVGGLLGGVVNKAFGRGPKELQNAGLNLGVTGDTLSAMSYAAYKEEGGWFTSDRYSRDQKALEGTAKSDIDKAFAVYRDGIANAFGTLGLDFSKGVSGFVEQAFDLGLDGMSAEEQAKKIATHFAEVTDRMAQYVANNLASDGALNITLKDGETVTAGFTRIAADLVGVNSVLGQLHQTALAFSVAGGNAASQLVALFGTLDDFKAATSSYYDNFYTEAEKVTNTRSNITASLAAVGLSLPDTREQFRKLVEAQDLTTVSGRAAYAALMSVNAAFAGIVPTAAEAAEALAQQQKSVAQAAFDTLTRTLDAERARLNSAFETASAAAQASIDGMAQSVTTLTSLSDRLRTALQSMSIAGSEGASRAAAQAQIRSDLALARAGGAESIDQDRLNAALSVIAKPSQALFGNFVDYARDFARTANDISALQSTTDASLSQEERLKKLAEDQLAQLKRTHDAELARLDDLTAQAKLQIDAINGVNTSVLSVGAAIAAFNQASTAAGGGKVVDKGLGTAVGTGTSYSNGGVANSSGYYSGADDIAATITALTNSAAISAAYSQNFGRAPDLGGQAYWEQVAQQQGLAAALAGLEQERLNGSHANGLVRVPFDGYTARLHRDEMVVPAMQAELFRQMGQDGWGATGGGELAQEIRLLREENATMREELEKTRKATEATAAALRDAQAGRAPLKVTQ